MFIDKTPIKSKKFLFAVFGELVLAGVILTIALLQPITWSVSAVLVILAIGMMVIPVGYVLGQAAIDKVAAMVQSVSGMFGGNSNDSISEDDIKEIQ